MIGVDARNYDAWVTREPDYGPDFVLPPKCEKCGRFMRDDPIHTIAVDEVDSCDGAVHPEFGALCEGWPDAIGQPHEPHLFVVGGYVAVYRRCTSGHISREMVV